MRSKYVQKYARVNFTVDRNEEILYELTYKFHHLSGGDPNINISLPSLQCAFKFAFELDASQETSDISLKI